MAMEISEQIMEESINFADKLDKTISVLKSEYAGLRAGRANPRILDKVVVDYYGDRTPLSQLSNIAVTDARCLTVSVWDTTALKAAEKAILEANIGITPVNDGKVLRLVFPELTEERRKDMVKQIKKMSEDSKIALRNIRRDMLEYLKKLKTEKKLTEDEYSVHEKDVEKEFTKRIEQIDQNLKEKEKEVMTV